MFIPKGLKALGSAFIPILIFSQTALASPTTIIYQNSAGQNIQVNYLNALTNSAMKSALIAALSTNYTTNLPIYVMDDSGKVVNYLAAINKNENYLTAISDSSVLVASAPIVTQQMNTDGSVTSIGSVSVSSVAPVSVTTSVGTAPVLPSTVTATMSDGTTKSVNVTWAAVDASSYAAAGTFTVTGTIAESSTIKATATITVGTSSFYVISIT